MLSVGIHSHFTDKGAEAQRKEICVYCTYSLLLAPCQTGLGYL